MYQCFSAKKDIFPWERIATTYTISDVRNYWKCNYLFYVFSSNKCSTASNKLDLWIIILWWIISEQHFKIIFSQTQHLFHVQAEHFCQHPLGTFVFVMQIELGELMCEVTLVLFGVRQTSTGLILGLRLANERRHYFVTTSLSGGALA